ncbi:amidase [Sinorhizobium phage phiM9]|uniref:N-acetylmuramoyl-L-alanine amidase n=1 Tax=Sinorhizobium phage phiM9 TaxID=1636182 RepID=A0A0F6R5Z1_9CAUD|nr:amidase [Sinorhizobium phage phiM9]AKE44775.1 putative N-acetylmuramoyl-L-alanine amidase [Sinorhizobium phage phiM9]
MTLTIKNGVLSGENVKQYSTTKKNPGRVNKKKFVVIHYTAGGSFENDVKTLSSSSKQVSCHLVISRKGEIAMIGNFNDVQWHAGASQWKGINGLNGYSIGIELTNPGWMEIMAPGVYKTYYGQVYNTNGNVLPGTTFVEAKHPALGYKTYGWMDYSKEQLQALSDVIDVLKETYPSIVEVVGHEQISPGRKQDPGIGIILSQKLLDKFNETNFDGSDNFYTKTDPVAKANTTTAVVTGTSNTYRVKTTGSALRIRAAASPNSKVIGGLNNGDIITVEIIQNGWAKLKYIRKVPNNLVPIEGYVSAAYITTTLPDVGA